jgi:hypothetical protein
MKEEEIYNKKLKEFFNKVGLEKTSSDFTGAVMKRIQFEPGIEKIKVLPRLPYFLIALLFTSGILILPYGNYIADFLNNLNNMILSVDYSFIYDIIVSTTDTIIEYISSSTGLIILGLSVILFPVLIYINYSVNSYKTSGVSLTSLQT